MITVNKELCRGCLACVRVCPFTVLQAEGKGREGLSQMHALRGSVSGKCHFLW